MRISKTWRNSTILNIPMIKPKLHYYDLGSGVVAFSSTRHGGVGTDTHASFSINKYCGDDVDAIALNRKALASELGIETERLIVPHQVHGVESRLIANDFFSLSQRVRRSLDGRLHSCAGLRLASSCGCGHSCWLAWNFATHCPQDGQGNDS